MIIKNRSKLGQHSGDHSDSSVNTVISLDVFSCVLFTPQNQKGVAEEEVWREIWLPDYLTQYGEDAWAQHITKTSRAD